MYDFKPCAVSGCESTALSGLDRCAKHAADPDAAAKAVAELLSGPGPVKSVNAAGLRFEGLDLSGRRFYSCSFSQATLRNVAFSGCTFRMCFFDFASIDSCDFSGIDAQFCSFAGARLLNASFENSELVHNNFDGISASYCTFNYSNLYNSRLILAELEKVDFIDCNLKRSFIIPAKELDVSWRLSNTQEAIRDLERIAP